MTKDSSIYPRRMKLLYLLRGSGIALALVLGSFGCLVMGATFIALLYETVFK